MAYKIYIMQIYPYQFSTENPLKLPITYRLIWSMRLSMTYRPCLQPHSVQNFLLKSHLFPIIPVYVILPFLCHYGFYLEHLSNCPLPGQQSLFFQALDQATSPPGIHSWNSNNPPLSTQHTFYVTLVLPLTQDLEAIC